MFRFNKENKFQGRHRFLLAGTLCLLAVCFLMAQDKKPQHDKKAQPEQKVEPEKAQGKKKTRVDLLHADQGQADKLARPDVQVLIGSVKLRHDSMYMYCDSALIYEKTNSFEAFSNVRMEQGDTLFIYGDYLFYDGMTQIAQLRENVKMINRNTTLLTDSLNYDRLYNLGYYFDGGTLMDEENVLTSDWGEYSPATKLSVFNLTSNIVPFCTDFRYPDIARIRRLPPSWDPLILSVNKITSTPNVAFTIRFPDKPNCWIAQY